jgi:hypothetical protein
MKGAVVEVRDGHGSVAQPNVVMLALRKVRYNQVFWSIYSQSLPSLDTQCFHNPFLIRTCLTRAT